LIVHIAEVCDLDKICRFVPEKAKILAAHFWPGPLTLLLPKSEIISDQITAGSDLVAVRIPNHPQALALLKELNEPFVAPSANPANAISPTSSTHVYEYFNGKIPMVLEGGECEKGIESTIVGFENDEVIIHRLGSLSLEDIEKVVGKVIIKNNPKEKIVSPGQFSKHYAPKKPMILTNDVSQIIERHQDKKIGLLIFNSHFETNDSIVITKNLSQNGHFDEAMRNIYAYLHQLDAENIDLIVAELLPEISVGSSINDRLKRAASSHLIF
jgi:L-threonylcarbamoyladenylate synthase